MASFVLELYRPGLDRAGGARIVRFVRQAIARLDAPGVRYAGSTLAPTDEVCYIRLEAPARPAVEELVHRLAIEGARISEVIDLG